jgi:nucleotide-binding universal stress UspA family protein
MNPYQTILVTLENSATDRAIIEHIKPLAKLLQSRIVLLHVATGVQARYHGENAGGQEVDQSRAYLKKVQAEFVAEGIRADAELAYGSDPAKAIVNWITQNGCDLVAMSTHGHQFVADLILGDTANRVQHNTSVPVLLLRAK